MENSQKENNSINEEDIIRIISAYTCTKQDQGDQPKTYQIGGVWESILRISHQELIMALENEDIDRVKSILSNFTRNKISIGLSLFGGLPTTFFHKIRRVNLMNRNHYVWKKMTQLPDEVLEYPKEIGNMPGMDINGKLIIQPSHRLSYFAQRIQILVSEENKRKVIVEVGGGYGGIPYHLFKNMDINCTYIDIDIPEICVIASYFLKSIFPDKKFLFYGEVEHVDVKEYDIIIMPNYFIQELPDKCCDLVFNSHSLTEMDYSTAKEYLKQINRICKKYFLHANHEYGSEYSTSTGKLKKHVVLNDPEFELPKREFKQIYRFPELIQNDGREYKEFDYWEYLYERIS